MMRQRVSTKNKYYISDERRLELKHFCMQYNDWVYELYKIKNSSITPQIRYSNVRSNTSGINDPVYKLATRKQQLENNIKIVEELCVSADPELYKFIFASVTQGKSFENLKARLEIPCSADMWYDRLRRFYWLLDKRDVHLLL